ncbi:MAG: 30S ribosomal protein S4 [archaeon]
MGDPKKSRKMYKRPKMLWNTELLNAEKKLVETYGLKNKRELWLAESFLKRKRDNARGILALPLERRNEKERELVESLARIGLLEIGASLDSVLGTETKDVLERRLQTIVWRKNLALTQKQARQFITHGKISVNGKKVSVPGYIVPKSEEDKVAYYKQELKLQPKEDKVKKRLAREALEEAAKEAAAMESRERAGESKASAAKEGESGPKGAEESGSEEK